MIKTAMACWIKKSWSFWVFRFENHCLMALAAAVLFGCAPRAAENPAPANRPLFEDIHGKMQNPWKTPDDHVATVWVFTTFDCPVANAYAPSINRIARRYGQKKVRFFFVHIDPEELTVAKARKHAREYGYDTAPVLIDTNHALVRHAGATVTPEAAVFTHDGTRVYRGRIDNWYADFGKKRRRPTVHDLKDVLDKLIAGRPVVPRVTEPVGCMIFELEAAKKK